MANSPITWRSVSGVGSAPDLSKAGNLFNSAFNQFSKAAETVQANEQSEFDTLKQQNTQARVNALKSLEEEAIRSGTFDEAALNQRRSELLSGLDQYGDAVDINAIQDAARGMAGRVQSGLTNRLRAQDDYRIAADIQDKNALSAALANATSEKELAQIQNSDLYKSAEPDAAAALFNQNRQRILTQENQRLGMTQSRQQIEKTEDELRTGARLSAAARKADLSGAAANAPGQAARAKLKEMIDNKESIGPLSPEVISAGGAELAAKQERIAQQEQEIAAQQHQVDRLDQLPIAEFRERFKILNAKAQELVQSGDYSPAEARQALIKSNPDIVPNASKALDAWIATTTKVLDTAENGTAAAKAELRGLLQQEDTLPTQIDPTTGETIIDKEASLALINEMGLQEQLSETELDAAIARHNKRTGYDKKKAAIERAQARAEKIADKQAEELASEETRQKIWKGAYDDSTWFITQNDWQLAESLWQQGIDAKLDYGTVLGIIKDPRVSDPRGNINMTEGELLLKEAKARNTAASIVNNRSREATLAARRNLLEGSTTQPVATPEFLDQIYNNTVRPRLAN